MTWSFDMSTAPRDSRVWLASPCGKVIPTTWDKKRGQWAGFATNGKPPIAWQTYVVPAHPNSEIPACSHASEDRQPVQASASADHRVGRGHEGGTTGQDAPAADPVTVASVAGFIPIIEDVGSV